MCLFFDIEFISLIQDVYFIFLVLVVEDDFYFYVEFIDFDVMQLLDWYWEYILFFLVLEQDGVVFFFFGIIVFGNCVEIIIQLWIWLVQWFVIEVWVDVFVYDWVLFCEFFGGVW